MKREGREHRNKKTIEAQKNWKRMILSLGGIYLKADSPQDAVDKLRTELEKRHDAARYAAGLE